MTSEDKSGFQQRAGCGKYQEDKQHQENSHFDTEQVKAWITTE